MGASHMLSFVSFSLSLLSQIPAALAHSALQPKLQASSLPHRNIVKPRD